MNSIVVFSVVISVALQLAAGSQRAYLPKLNTLRPKIYNQPIYGPGPIIQAPTPIIAAPPCGAPVLGQTIIDNSISRSLAETLQFLVVSDLLQSKLSPCTEIVAPVKTIVETIPPVVTETITNYPCPSFNAPSCFDMPYVSPCGTTFVESYPYGITETIVAPEFVLQGSPCGCGGYVDPVLGGYLPSIYY